jgi:hypothetical protein
MMRDKFGITPGTKIDISEYGSGLHLAPGGRAAKIVEDGLGWKVIETDHSFTQQALYRMIDEDRSRGMRWLGEGNVNS